MHILNIGLVTSLNHFEGGKLPQESLLTPDEVLTSLVQHGFGIAWHKQAESDTEQTLIVGVYAHGMTDGDRVLLTKVSNTLQQDCVAAFDTLNGKGYLIGDYADDWGGEFNPEYFILG